MCTTSGASGRSGTLPVIRRAGTLHPLDIDEFDIEDDPSYPPPWASREQPDLRDPDADTMLVDDLPPPWEVKDRSADPKLVDAAETASAPRSPALSDPDFREPTWDTFDPDLDDPGFGYFDPDLGFEPPPRRFLPLEDEPTTLVARYLFPTERYRGEWRRHWMHPLSRWTSTLAVSALIATYAPTFVPARTLQLVQGLLCLTGALISLRILAGWHLTRFVLTNRRLMLIEGVLRRRASWIPLSRAGEMRFDQTLLGRAFSYGDFVFDEVNWLSRMRRVACLPNPNELNLRVVEERYEPGAVERRLGSEYADDEEGRR
jgi:hypothetical protein